jgi:hypothetical protein
LLREGESRRADVDFSLLIRSPAKTGKIASDDPETLVQVKCEAAVERWRDKWSGEIEAAALLTIVRN